MATGPRRDEHEVGDRFGAWLRAGGRADPRPLTVTRPSAGHSNETLLVAGAGGAAGDRWVLRLPPRAPLMPDYDLGREAAVLEALADLGLPVPRPIAYETDPEHLGGPFLVLPMVDGHVVGEAPVFDPWVTESPLDDQARVQQGFVDVLARLHRLDVDGSGLGAILRSGSAADELEWWAAYLDWAFGDEPLPTLAAVLDELRATAPIAPTADRRTLLWGDARLGNVIYAEDRSVRTVLDWELATIGAPEGDLAWYLALDDLLESFVGRRVPGFLAREALVDAYTRAVGHPVEHLAWHELFALLRSAAINARIARLAAAEGGARRGAGGEDDPVVAALRRRLEHERSRS
jgi:aminoglycoside phosphotransferase (APT) family kinase protein